MYVWSLLHAAGLVLESKGMQAIFQKRAKNGQKNVTKGEKGKIFENLGKNVQNMKNIWKRTGDCVQFITCNKLLE